MDGIAFENTFRRFGDGKVAHLYPAVPWEVLNGFVVLARDEVPVAVSASVYWCRFTGCCVWCNPGWRHDLIDVEPSQVWLGCWWGCKIKEIRDAGFKQEGDSVSKVLTRKHCVVSRSVSCSERQDWLPCFWSSAKDRLNDEARVNCFKTHMVSRSVKGMIHRRAYSGSSELS